MMKFIASDLHLNHRQIIQYCPERVSTEHVYDVENPTEEDTTILVDLMNEKIISNWNSMIAKGDEVIILGDVAMGQIVKAPPLIRRLNGMKTLIAGNHDKTLIKLIKNDPSMSNLFVKIKDYYELSHVYGGKKHMICMSHFPMRFWNGQNRGTMFTHGHLHGSPCDVPGRIFDVGIDTNNLRPYLIDDVVEKLLKIDVCEEHHR